MLLPYQKLLTELAEHIGLDSATLLAQQEVCIDGLGFFLQQSADEEAPELQLSSAWGAMPAQRSAEIVRTLLQANHLWVGTGGGTLGLAPDGSTVTWCLRLPVQDLDGATLAGLLADVSELGQAWAEYIAADAGEAQVLLQALPMAFFLDTRA